jgi:sulfate/thiosulfate-binding protein
MRPIFVLITLGIAVGCGGETREAGKPGTDPATVTLLNVSYDPTRELYRDVNAAFARAWKDSTGQTVTVEMSHAGSGSQARAVIDGLAADVVTLALAYDVDAIGVRAKLIPPDGQSRLPHNSCPYTSTIVFLVRKGNPKKIHDWDDLVQPGIQVITPHPKTSGGARWNYLAAWGYVVHQELGSFVRLSDPTSPEVAAAQEKAAAFVGELFRHVPVLDRGARAATNTFVQNGIGDVLLAWENEAFLAIRDIGPADFEIVVPSLSILAEPPVAWIDANVQRKRTVAVARAYLEFLFSEAGQDLAAKHYYRPCDETVAARYVDRFPSVDLFTIDLFGGWQRAQAQHFADGGVFDRIYAPRP